MYMPTSEKKSISICSRTETDVFYIPRVDAMGYGTPFEVKGKSDVIIHSESKNAGNKS